MPNVAMWGRALRVMPRIDKGEWDELDIVSRWLIATRSAVIVMTLTSACFAGLLAVATALVGAPGPPGMARGPWIGALLVAAGVALPGWLGVLRRRESLPPDRATHSPGERTR